MPPTSPDPIPTPDTPDQQPPASSAPVSFVPHTPAGAVSPDSVRIRTSRHGELDTHELLHLLDTIEDERARGRFRESIYISVFIWMIVVWVLFYGPKYLWHAPQVRLASNTHQQELLTLNSPKLLHAPRVPTPPPVIDNKTLERLRETDRTPPSPTPQPTPQPTAAATPSTPQPTAAQPPPTPTPQPVPSHRPPPVLTDAPTPQPSSRPSIPGTTSASENMSNIARESAHAGDSRSSTMEAPLRGGGSMGAGSAILTDTQGVDFSAWKRHFDYGTMSAWRPLLPEEIYPPLSKTGETYLLVTINKDGSIADMKLEGSTHDEAINRSCWGSIVSQGRFDPLPKAFNGPNITLRLHYMVNIQQ